MLSQIRESQRVKYEMYMKEQAEKNQEDEQKNTEREESERECEREISLVYQLFDEWDKEMESVIPTEEYIMNLIPRITRVISYCKKHDMVSLLSDRVVRFVDTINTYNKYRRNSITEVQSIQQSMKTIFELCEMDGVTIESMDTSMDEEMARHIQETMYRNDDVYEQVELYHNIDANEYNEILPFCSTTKRIGLTLVQLRELAKRNSIKTTGTKEELCHRLHQYGKVRLL